MLKEYEVEIKEVLSRIEKIEAGSLGEAIDKAMEKKGESKKEFVKSLIFFSLFTGNVSLFSQFYIAMSYNKFKTYMKGMSNATFDLSDMELNMIGVSKIQVSLSYLLSILSRDRDKFEHRRSFRMERIRDLELDNSI